MSEVLASSRRLSKLLPELAPAADVVSVSDVSIDSRAVSRGGLFLACAGRRTHGLQHVAAAISGGVRAVLYEPADGLAVPEFPSDIFVAAVPELMRRVGGIADEFFGRPSAQLAVAGITGTNGKTTCAWLLANALRLCGRPAGYMGTIGIGMANAAADLTATTHTTSDAVSVHRQLEQLRRAGAQCVAMEISSHALDQGRIDAVRLRVAGFTNLTRDHLDYHGSMRAYAAAKARLFGWPGLECRVLNVDDAFGLELAQRYVAAGNLVVTARSSAGIERAKGLASKGARALLAENVRANDSGLSCEVLVGSERERLQTPLIGEFNIENALTVLGMLLALELPAAQALWALAQCSAPPGRMEVFGGGVRPLVIVDYAHTPDGLIKALQASRAHCSGRLRVVFGCGGDRDVGKRPLMALAAAQVADELVLTDDNPRTEAPARIVADMVAGLPERSSYVIVHDRAAAIQQAMQRSRAGDVLLIAGKGHEDYQIYGREKRAFSDQAVVRAAFEANS